MTPHPPARIRDEEVARLVLPAGRSELLEQIMSTSTGLVTTPVRRRRRPPRAVVVIASAAAVALIIGGPLLLRADRSAGPGVPVPGPGAPRTPAPPTPAPPTPGATPMFPVIGETGWRATHVSTETPAAGGLIEIGWERDGVKVGITSNVALPGLRQDRVEDRSEQPSGPQVVVADLSSPSWTYGPTDHTAIRPVEDGRFLEVRVEGADADEFARLTAAVTLVGVDELGPQLPDEVVLPAERDAVAAEMLRGVDLAPGSDPDRAAAAPNERSTIAADLIGAVTCGWIAEYGRARRGGDQARVDQVIDVLQDSGAWPLLGEVAQDNMMRSVPQDAAAEMSRGVPAAQLTAFGCGPDE